MMPRDIQPNQIHCAFLAVDTPAQRLEKLIQNCQHELSFMLDFAHARIRKEFDLSVMKELFLVKVMSHIVETEAQTHKNTKDFLHFYIDKTVPPNSVDKGCVIELLMKNFVPNNDEATKLMAVELTRFMHEHFKESTHTSYRSGIHVHPEYKSKT